MRVYFRTTVATAESIFREGFTDLSTEFGRTGVYLSTEPLSINDGFHGDVVICLDVPEELFARHDVTDTLQEEEGYRLALIPAAELNTRGKPQVYDHEFAGLSRRDLVQSIKRWEQDTEGSGREHAQRMQRAVEFFDRIGWLTPLKLREEAE